jgi:hypothetical protein
VRKNDPKVKDAECCASEEILSESLLVNEQADKGVQNAVIYLRKAPEGYEAPPVPTELVVLNSIGCQFNRHVFALRCGQTLISKTDDSVSHALHISAIRNNGILQLIQPNAPEGRRFTFERPESVPVPIRCNLHNWMQAYCIPLDHPFVAVTDAKGRFRIDGLPSGEHKFRVWHELAGYLQKELTVEIRLGEDREITLSYPPEAFKLEHTLER